MPSDIPPPFYFLVAVGLCFGLQHKASFLHGRSAFADRLLACSYCVGFHCGWVTWLCWAYADHFLQLVEIPTLGSVVSWCFACAWVCYATDTAVKRLETTDE